MRSNVALQPLGKVSLFAGLNWQEDAAVIGEVSVTRYLA
jgi:hypothetical protein